MATSKKAAKKGKAVKATKKVAKADPKASKKAAKAEKGGKKAKGEKIDLEGLTGLALHRAKAHNAKLSGKPLKAAKKGKSKRAALPTFAAPDDFKPHFLEVFARTEKDGLFGCVAKATRYQGRYDPEAEDKKKADLASYDPATLAGIIARISATTYATNAAKRLPASTAFRILLRVNKKAADGSLAIGIKQIAMGVKSAKSGALKYKALDKKDPFYRKIRKSARILPAAFKNVQMPPKRVRGKKVEAEE